MDMTRIRQCALDLVNAICDELENETPPEPESRTDFDWLGAGGGTVWPTFLRSLAEAPAGAPVSLVDIALECGASPHGVAAAIGRPIRALGGYRELPLEFEGGDEGTVTLTDPAVLSKLRANLKIGDSMP